MSIKGFWTTEFLVKVCASVKRVMERYEVSESEAIITVADIMDRTEVEITAALAEARLMDIIDW